MRLVPAAFSLASGLAFATCTFAATAPITTNASNAPAPAAPPSPPRDLSYNAGQDTPLTPAEQQARFALPDGFTIELVAAESPGFGKFITVDWDARMRLWSMTALEYPVDGNEQKAASDALFASGGRDKVIVFDSPYGVPASGGAAVTTPPRVFAENLVMPLGVLPYKDGALVQYGADIRFYHDTNGDGRADRHDVILTGFGTQDSHLFPHQFYRQPGGSIFAAQGLFNYSKVRRPDGSAFADGSTEIVFNQCKLARFSVDGSHFENLTSGPNNIWGLLTSRTGETFMQEANDIGYSVIPYEPGILVRTGSNDRLRPYQPLMPPPLGEQRMGGTGLSGLALAEDHDGWFGRVGQERSKNEHVFFLANPIANSIQVVRATHDGSRFHFNKQADFLTTTDRWFRPIAIHFGPDGALYVVDWYNKIISHNEVPRAHPDRDKSRGRIWRIRHREQPRTLPPDLTRLDDRAVLSHIGGPSALVSRLAWLELIDRKATGLIPDLQRVASDRAAAPDRRLGALWALEGLQPVTTSVLRTLIADPQASIRREAIRIAAATARPEAEFIALATPLLEDPHPSVRTMLGDALRRVPQASPAVMEIAARLGRAPLTTGSEWDRYQRDFERYLARWALELNPDATRNLLNSAAGQALAPENQLLALLALGGREAALGLTRHAAKLGRPLTEHEVPTLAAYPDEPDVRDLLVKTLQQPSTREAALRALLAIRTRLDASALTDALTAAAQALLTSSAPAEIALGAEVAGAFKLLKLEPDLARILRTGATGTPLTLSPGALAALRALREIGGGPSDVFENIVRHGRPPAARDAALAALGSSRDPASIERLIAVLPSVTPAQRQRAMESITSTPAGSRTLLQKLKAGTVKENDISLTAADRLRVVLPENPDAAALWQRLGGGAAASDTPAVLTPAASAALAEKFARFSALATQSGGNADNGRGLFTALCLNCHQQGGKGGQIAPSLDGVGLTGTEAILRNVLTPSAAMESAYRTFRVVLRDGSVHEGFLAIEEPASIVLRIPGSEDRRIDRSAIRESGFLARSLMPEGLLDGLTSEQVTDLFTHLQRLR